MTFRRVSNEEWEAVVALGSRVEQWALDVAGDEWKGWSIIVIHDSSAPERQRVVIRCLVEDEDRARGSFNELKKNLQQIEPAED